MPRRPDILIFNPDQWRGDVLGHAGNPAAVTPVIDRLVETEAVSFTRAFCQNPVCTPSRCSFMTGWYPHVRGHRTMYHMLRKRAGETNLLARLREEGYFVWWGGKNDLVPGQFGFTDHADVKHVPTEADYKRWGHAPAPSRHSHTSWRGQAGGDSYYSFHAGCLPADANGRHFDGDWANVMGACDFIRSYDGDRPLCVYLPLDNPHPPYGVEEPYFSAIDRRKLPPRTPAPDDPSVKPLILDGIRRNQNLGGWDERRWDELRATYYGQCMRLDEQFGMVLDALRDAGRYHETAAFLFSDHGDFTGDYGLVEKTQNTFEDCLARVPLIVKPPRGTDVRPGVREQLVELVDFPATVYELTGVAPGYSHFGRSLLPLIGQDGAEGRDAVFCEGGRLIGERQAMELESRSSRNPEGLYWPRISLQTSDERPWHTKAAMCRTAEYKYVRRLHEGDELYDLRDDPRETTNLIGDGRRAGAAAELRERMLRWYMETCDVVPNDADER
jgi:arylsulfatase A-like enzyme